MLSKLSQKNLKTVDFFFINERKIGLTYVLTASEGTAHTRTNLYAE